MTPVALILTGFVCYFLYRSRFVILSLAHSWVLNRRTRRMKREKERARMRGKNRRNEVHFYTVKQVWDDEEEKRSA